MTGQVGENGFPETAIGIIQRLFDVTTDMMERKEEIDFLVDQIALRQPLIEAFDALPRNEEGFPFDTVEEKVKANELILGIIEMDKEISVILTQARDEVKANLADSQKKQQVLNYANQVLLSGSGSYMDYRK